MQFIINLYFMKVKSFMLAVFLVLIIGLNHANGQIIEQDSLISQEIAPQNLLQTLLDQVQDQKLQQELFAEESNYPSQILLDQVDNLEYDDQDQNQDLYEDKDLQFQKFKRRFNRNYSPTQQKKREQIFGKNLQIINDHNSKPTEYLMGVNQFADITDQQFQSTYLMTPMEKNQVQMKMTAPIPKWVLQMGQDNEPAVGNSLNSNDDGKFQQQLDLGEDSQWDQIIEPEDQAESISDFGSSDLDLFGLDQDLNLNDGWDKIEDEDWEQNTQKDFGPQSKDENLKISDQLYQKLNIQVQGNSL